MSVVSIEKFNNQQINMIVFDYCIRDCYTDITKHYFIFESVFFDVPRAIYRLLLLNKQSDKICENMSENLDLKSLK